MDLILILNRVSPTNEFSLMSGSIFAMIGISAYMGFKNIIFVGMDYLSTNPKHGHFYEYGIRIIRLMYQILPKIQK